ncbi:25306_t:CDS:2 [Dentiscutata erythropus]|uniref:25306_t:CDS:1 n=1 Tax=Dentiscutata erythropus TaxID=1348616 RepID=A0A9N9FLH4_9GLOM|nr:25306_t:CDS:2 [Dentiscutata erythropus]
MYNQSSPSKFPSKNSDKSSTRNIDRVKKQELIKDQNPKKIGDIGGRKIFDKKTDYQFLPGWNPLSVLYADK